MLKYPVIKLICLSFLNTPPPSLVSLLVLEVLNSKVLNFFVKGLYDSITATWSDHLILSLYLPKLNNTTSPFFGVFFEGSVFKIPLALA